MSTVKNDTSLFDDDFEVTYFEDDVDITTANSSEPKSMSEALADETLIDEPEVEDTSDSPTLTDCETGYEKKSNLLRSKNIRNNSGPGKKSKANRKSIVPKKSFHRSKSYARRKLNPKVPDLLSPVKDTAKYGIKAIYHTARFIMRTISLFLIAGIIGVLAYHFWRGAASYGALHKIISDRNYTLAAYTAIAAVLLMFEVISLLWASTGTRIREGRKVYKEDYGRGLFSFIFIFISSYLSFRFSSFLPKSLGSAAIMSGIKGALEIFGSLHNILLVFCAAGVISCLIRKCMTYLHGERETH